MTVSPETPTNGSNGIHTLDAPNGEAKKSRKQEDAPSSPKRTHQQATYRVRCESISPLLMDRFDEQMMVDALIFGIRPPADRETPLELRCVDKLYRDDEGRVILKDNHLYACLNGAGAQIKVGKAGKIATGTKSKLFSFLEILEEEIPLIFTPGRGKKQPSEVGRNPTSLKPWKGFKRVKVRTDATAAKPQAEGSDELSDALDQLSLDVTNPELDPESPWRVDVKRGVGNTGLANAIVRPCFEEWSFDVTINVDYTGLEGLTSEHIRQLFTIAGKCEGLLSYRPSCKGPYGRFRVASFEEITTR